MKKFLFLLVAVIGSMTGISAQDSQIATLFHGTTVKSFYGADAFIEAYTVADHGDCITLTGGVFNVVDIEKAIIVRGNGGAENNNDNGTLLTTFQTVSNGDLNINIPSGTSKSLTIEGVYFNNVVNINGNKQSDAATLINSHCSVVAKKCSPRLVQCYIPSINADTAPSIIYATNCIIDGYVVGGSTTSTLGMELNHCTIYLYDYRVGFAQNLSFKNCIIVTTGQQVTNSSSASYCVGFSAFWGYDEDYKVNIFENCIASNCKLLKSERTELFEDGGSWGKTCSFRLLESAKTTYLGDDGTQVGAYGGSTPYGQRFTGPSIKKFSVLTTNNGNQLNVKMNVE